MSVQIFGVDSQGKSEERPAALARPATLSEVESLLKWMLTEDCLPVNNKDVLLGWTSAVKFVLRRLGTLDQGPIAKRLSKAEFRDALRNWLSELDSDE